MVAVSEVTPLMVAVSDTPLMVEEVEVTPPLMITPLMVIEVVEVTPLIGVLEEKVAKFVKNVKKSPAVQIPSFLLQSHNKFLLRSRNKLKQMLLAFQVHVMAWLMKQKTSTT